MRGAREVRGRWGGRCGRGRSMYSRFLSGARETAMTLQRKGSRMSAMLMSVMPDGISWIPRCDRSESAMAMKAAMGSAPASRSSSTRMSTKWSSATSGWSCHRNDT